MSNVTEARVIHTCALLELRLSPFRAVPTVKEQISPTAYRSGQVFLQPLEPTECEDVCTVVKQQPIIHGSIHYLALLWSLSWVLCWTQAYSERLKKSDVSFIWDFSEDFLGRSLTRLLCPHSEPRLSHIYCTFLFYLWLLAIVMYSVHEECMRQTCPGAVIAMGGQRTGAWKHQLWSQSSSEDVRVLAPRP